jgi:hypothetical protein
MDTVLFDSFWRPEKPACRTDFEIVFRVNELVDGSVVRFIAAAPPEFSGSFSGSGLPFGTVDAAMSDTPNVGRARADLLTGEFTIALRTPNTFYCRAGTVKVQPCVFVAFTSHGVSRVAAVEVGGAVPFRDLTHDRRRSGPEFYSAPRTVATQAEKLVARGCTASVF